MGDKLDEVFKAVKDSIEDLITIKNILNSKPPLEVIGDKIKNQIIKRTRLGRGVEENGAPAKKFEKLEKSTIKDRQRLKKRGELLGIKARPGKAAINRTGELIENLDVVVGRGTILIEPHNVKNVKKAENLAKIKNYQFLNLSKGEINLLEKELYEYLAKQVAKKINK